MSAAVEIVSNLGLWEKFEDGKTVSMAEILELTGADEIIISTTSQPFLSHMLEN